ncbi:MAG TPA: hypothetical protein PKA56_01565 [Solirubrobacterales bacterium]|jgi:hypothetical protein|nr:hypothetical protein [Solirubrobacterales bacterium]HMU27311.1 hypothetical protein [Solirubrobacterales bacterium]HMX70424.1 hypothetical protein [Solirubrobacterales bacterium]HMY25212.1 hypothetical protein [Solirubrobacterales bacterium]HNA24208.1 hypothetical protein [Solirubrobacterales bacterium]
MPIDNRPFPRFVADASRHGIPHGRFAERLATAFKDACREIDDLPAGTEIPEEFTWFPERAWSGRVWVPVSADGEAVLEENSEPEPIEFFGFVSFVQPEGGDPTDFKASADFTDVVAADNPDWTIDISDEVIGTWLGEQGREAAMTLVWGRALVRDAFAVTAELDDVTVDQDPLFGGQGGRADRFTLIAPDALKNYGDDAYLEIKLWTSRGKQVARESLYEIEEPQTAPEQEPAE